MHPHFLLLFLLLFSITPSHALVPDRFLRSQSQQNASIYFEVTRPLPTDYLIPSCSLTLLHHDFNNTIGFPPVSANYSPPANCSAPWTAVVVEFAASCSGEQYDRIAAVWIDGIEILRTSTAEPTENGILWKVRKDVTRYVSVLQRSNSTVSVMLENLVNDVFTGIYHVNVSLHFYVGIGDSLEIVKRGEEGNEFKLGRKLGFLGKGSEDKEGKLGFLGEESEEREGKLGFLGEESGKLGFLGEEGVDLEKRLGFSVEESEDRESGSGVFGGYKEKKKKKEKEKEKDKDGKHKKKKKEKEKEKDEDGEHKKKNKEKEKEKEKDGEHKKKKEEKEKEKEKNKDGKEKKKEKEKEKKKEKKEEDMEEKKEKKKEKKRDKKKEKDEEDNEKWGDEIEFQSKENN